VTEVVIVGSGVIGASIAWHLASRGCRDVRVVDWAPTAGEGSTSKATGGFRAQFATDVNVRLSLLSRAKLLRFKEETGVDPEYRPCGYLFLARDADQLRSLRAAQRMQRAAGLGEAREVTPAEIHEINPAVALDGIAGGTFCPSDGFIRPMKILEGYVTAAQRLGVRFEYGVAVGDFKSIAAKHTVNATGAWAGELSRIPVTPLKRQVAATVATSVLLLLLMPHETPSSFDMTFDSSWIDSVVKRAHVRVPILRDVPIDRAACWAGLYEMSPDKHVLLGKHEGVWVANGSSGHGNMHAPAIGELMAQMILGETTTIDVTALRPSRFAEGKANPCDGLL